MCAHIIIVPGAFVFDIDWLALGHPTDMNLSIYLSNKDKQNMPFMTNERKLFLQHEKKKQYQNIQSPRLK